MRKCLTLVWLILAGTNTFAQIPKPDSLGAIIILKITPLALFDLDNTVQVGLEVPMKNPAWTIQQEAGYGHSAFNLWYGERRQHPDRETWRFRTQIRYYFRQQNQNSPYLAGEYLFKKNSEEKYESVGVDCTNGPFGPCAYFQNRATHLGRFVSAFHVKWGWQFPMGERMTFDTYVGGGIRSLTVRYLSLPENAQINNGRGFFDFRTDRPGRYGPLPSFSAGFHFGWRL
ncbi:DUF3575 domain-containing protein [Persicitalea jodogahamensis]|uniref:DUF3575 domain-containing protein n=1 Tax=Persicitalea jodogahamensis TaxID=402147 RepID=A0A8J3D359_9BACT|nr:DUF3575 domain-containing protein [Persicitalea jodogahamensis]GHB65201.1 hypothetical protein GCM10007390_19120 [Persicitalea jodogahamensis]